MIIVTLMKVVMKVSTIIVKTMVFTLVSMV